MYLTWLDKKGDFSYHQKHEVDNSLTSIAAFFQKNTTVLQKLNLEFVPSLFVFDSSFQFF